MYQGRGSIRGRGRAYHFRNSRPGEKQLNMKTAPGQSSKKEMKNISKHDNNCCKDISLHLELDELELVFFEELKSMWNMVKKSPPVVGKLHHYLRTCKNPYADVLRLVCNCQEFYSAKSKSLPMFIMEEFKTWSTVYRDKIIHLLNIHLKFDSFKVILRQNNLSLTKLVVETFEIAQDRDMFLDIIRCMIDKKQYKEACQYATLLNLQDKFVIEDFLVPLLVQDKLFCIDEFLKENQRHQIELIGFMDSVLGKPSIREAMEEYVIKLNIPDVKYDKFHMRSWKKLMTRFSKMFKISSELTPNYNKKKNEGALNFLLHKRFIENSFGDESWKEMVQEAVGNEKELQQELVYQVAQYGEIDEALKWAHFYNIDRKDWPHIVRMHEENPNGDRLQQRTPQSQKPEECWDDEIVLREPIIYHKISLQKNCIHLIDTPLKFENFLDTGFVDVDVIGIDCEWKPTFGVHANELALMQIATRKNVFVLDIINLSKAPYLWQELSKFVFNNCDILKLGFSIIGDINMIKQALPDLNFSPKQVGFLDLCSLWKNLERFPKFKFPYEVQKGGQSLSTLVQHCLGCVLDKSDQFSNWEKRPLRDSQITYAALDAYCLIETYDIIKQCAEEGLVPFEDICYQLMTNEKIIKKKTKKVVAKKKDGGPRHEIPQPPSPHLESVPAGKIKIVCDTMLQGLGKKLRSCGIDTAILENVQDHMICVKIAQDEHRYILTKGYEIFKMLQGYVSAGGCYRVISDNVEEQMKEVLDYYKIIVTRDHVFSRCQACNGSSFIKVSRSTMNALVKSTESYKLAPPVGFYEDEATGFSSEDDNADDFEYARAPVSATRKWDLYPDEKIDVGLCQTRLGSKIQVTAVPKPLLSKYDFFYVCEECGKVYWDGSHFEKVLQGRLQGIVQ